MYRPSQTPRLAVSSNRITQELLLVIGPQAFNTTLIRLVQEYRDNRVETTVHAFRLTE